MKFAIILTTLAVTLWCSAHLLPTVAPLLYVPVNLLAAGAVPLIAVLATRADKIREWPRLAADADYQHAALMAGDDEVGTMGRYLPQPEPANVVVTDGDQVTRMTWSEFNERYQTHDAA